MRKKRNRYRPDRTRRRKLLKYWLKAAVGLVLSLGAIVCLSAALAHSYYALVNAPWFRVEEVAIIGLKHLNEDEILNALMIPPEASLLNLKSSQLAKQLESLPWLESSLVKFSLPNRIVVEVAEREPLAVIHAEDFYLIDAGGKLVSRASAEQKQGFLLVEGFSGRSLKEGDTAPPEALKGLKALLSALEQAKDWLPPTAILKSRWNAETGFALYSARNNICIQLGWDGFNQKLHHLDRVFRILEERQLWNSVVSIDLDYEDRAYVEGLFPFSKGS
jgi:cell division protein FtsQ